jgi:predicted transglutaminase-like cysteine proteinase
MLRIAATVAIAALLVISAVVAVVIVAKINLNPTGRGNDHLYSDNTTIVQTYYWTFERHQYSLQLNITAGEYYEYRDKWVSRSPSTNDLPAMAQFVTPDDPVVEEVAARLAGMSQNRSFDEVHTLNFMLAFVQGVGYSYDNASVGQEDYWRYSVETLWDHTGDCEDLSILYASIVEASGHDAVLLLFVDAGHMAAGVDCPGVSGTCFDYQSVNYFYCETTAQGWEVGEEPPLIQGDLAKVVQVP